MCSTIVSILIRMFGEDVRVQSCLALCFMRGIEIQIGGGRPRRSSARHHVRARREGHRQDLNAVTALRCMDILAKDGGKKRCPIRTKLSIRHLEGFVTARQQDPGTRARHEVTASRSRMLPWNMHWKCPDVKRIIWPTIGRTLPLTEETSN
ncbi:hypothetical protein FVEG_15298 [Fusarium verticillioides 7600]|uniref:Uncharacterized protein n=1 Tax=Gibberella moniliformis (strain M3125 / FGSC 7600) TaxID=334819 RepID=W7LQP9_GIBM7|nr:hypothetical protein FVEG_15298 [Fusarium verticillioides 7600]EWG41503.1 hypothetical protein FVEG_15298 [Fusarium verticillioides 7600]